MPLDSISDAIAAIRDGQLVVVVDDEDRENEGDLIMAASKATPEKIGFMVRHTSGILCAPMEAERARALHLDPMVADNRDPMRTAFTVSVDYEVGLTTGISAAERANTLSALANHNCVAEDFRRPGHIFPLISKPGGTLIRSGHTEAATDLTRLAELQSVGVLAEIVNDDGSVKRLPELVAFARENGLLIVSIEELIQHRMRTESIVERVHMEDARTPIRLPATAMLFRTPFDATLHIAVVFGDLGDGHGVPCRIHHERPVEDLLNPGGAQRWLVPALERFSQAGRGVLIYVRDPMTHRAAANGERKSDGARLKRWREIGLGAQILRHLNVTSIDLLATMHREYVGLGGFGIEIENTVLVPE